jgi:cytochrome c-type biogenesis protein
VQSINSRTTFLHALALVAGFTLVFTLLGASVGLLGNRVLEDIMPLIIRVGSIMLVVFALQVAHLKIKIWQWGVLALVIAGLTYWMAGAALFQQNTRILGAVLMGLVVLAGAGWDKLILAVLALAIGALGWLISDYGSFFYEGQLFYAALRILEAVLVIALIYLGNLTNVFDREMRMDMGNRLGGVSYLRSGAVGVVFAAGWTPCVGPILASILLLASQSQTVGQGALLLFVYSLGLGIPFLLAGALFSRLTVYLPKFYKHLPTISIISGLLLILIALLMFTGSLAKLSQVGFLFEGVYDFEESLVPESAQISLLLAFVAGLLSFLSPCVLPLVPAYLGYLSGAALGGATASVAAEQTAAS